MTEKQKFALYQQIQSLGFSYDEAKAIRRIEIVLRRWSKAASLGKIRRDTLNKTPFRLQVKEPIPAHLWYPIADREAGALRRLRGIVSARNRRANAECETGAPDHVLFHHRPHPTECNLFLLTRAQLGDADISTAVERGLAVFSP